MLWTASLALLSKFCFCPKGQKFHIFYYLLSLIYFSFPIKNLKI